MKEDSAERYAVVLINTLFMSLYLSSIANSL